MSIKTILKEAQDNKQLVAVYTDKDDWDLFAVGYVAFIDDKHVALKSLSRYGEANGYEIRRLSDIFRVETDSLYTNKLEHLKANQGQIFSDVNFSSEVKNNIIVTALEKSLNEKRVVWISGHDSDDSFMGFVEKFDGEFVTLRLIDEYGLDDGLASYQISEIRELDFNPQQGQVRYFLYQQRQKQ